jgi:hypothetical protein
MGTQYIDWDTNWSTTSIAASSVTNTSTATTAAISLDQKIACQISVACAYGGTATEGLKVYLLADSNSTDEAVADVPARAYQLPYSTSTTYRRVYSIPATDYSSFKVHVTNNSGATVTVTVTYKLAVVTTV